MRICICASGRACKLLCQRGTAACSRPIRCWYSARASPTSRNTRLTLTFPVAHAREHRLGAVREPAERDRVSKPSGHDHPAVTEMVETEENRVEQQVSVRVHRGEDIGAPDRELSTDRVAAQLDILGQKRAQNVQVALDERLDHPPEDRFHLRAVHGVHRHRTKPLKTRTTEQRGEHRGDGFLPHARWAPVRSSGPHLASPPVRSRRALWPAGADDGRPASQDDSQLLGRSNPIAERHRRLADAAMCRDLRR